MEPLDEQIAQALTEQDTPAQGPADILIVHGDPESSRLLVGTLASGKHRCKCATTLDEARNLLKRHVFDLMILDPHLENCNGLDLIADAEKRFPWVKTLVTGTTDSYRAVVAAMRRGAMDYINIKTRLAELPDRVTDALIKARLAYQREQRIDRLKRICKELNVARREISQQIDILCNDLASAYEGINEQMSEVAMASEFRALIRQELDIEDLLRTTLEYMLTRTGPTNAALFLPDGADAYGLGAYVNYDCPRESISALLDQLGSAVCRQMENEAEIVRFDDAAEFAQWTGLEIDFFGECEVVSFACRHDGRTMAVVVMFRNKSKPFETELIGTIDTLREIFAEQLSHVIHVHHRAEPQWCDESAGAFEDDAGEFEEIDFDETEDDDAYGFGGLAA
jgi:DNA-binding response OmpR family regulator